MNHYRRFTTKKTSILAAASRSAEGVYQKSNPSLAGMSALVLAVFIGTLAMPTSGRADPVDTKTRYLRGWIGQDITQQNGKVAWSQEGTSKDCSEPANGDSGDFVVGNGAANSVSNGLCEQFQKSSWDLKASYDADTKKTTWKRTGSAEAGEISAQADVNNRPGNSKASTTFSTTGKVNFSSTVGITAAGAKDDASLASVFGGLSQAGDSESFLLNSSLVLKAGSRLFAQNGASASIGPAGLTLLTTPGELSGFSAQETNNYNHSQNLAWSVTFDGRNLVVSGINPNLFQAISGGEFLPYDAMPGIDLTASVGPGTLEYDASAYAYDQAPAPEPSSFFLFGSGLVGLGAVRRRRRARVEDRVPSHFL